MSQIYFIIHCLHQNIPKIYLKVLVYRCVDLIASKKNILPENIAGIFYYLYWCDITSYEITEDIQDFRIDIDHPIVFCISIIEI